jgi:hypothetical protein
VERGACLWCMPACACESLSPVSCPIILGFVHACATQARDGCGCSFMATWTQDQMI